MDRLSPAKCNNARNTSNPMNKTLAKVNFDYCQETLQLKNGLELSYLDLAQRLHKIQLNKMYLPNFDTFDDFLDEIKVSRATASKMINIWLTFVVKYRIDTRRLADAGGWSVVAEILPYATSKTAAVDWLVKAKVNRRRDLRKLLTEEKTGIIMSTCKHVTTVTITFKRCEDCGETFRVYDDEEKVAQEK